MVRILIVEDAQYVVDMLKEMLEACGHQVVGAALNGEGAIEKYKELKPDLVTLDIVMPKMDGLTTLEHILKHDPDAKIVVVSALGESKIREESLEVGAKAFIAKPFEMEDLIKTIEQVMESPPNQSSEE